MDRCHLLAEDPISKMDSLVNNFEKIKFPPKFIDTESDRYTKSYTNFSVSEILKSSIGNTSTEKFESDSEGNCTGSPEPYSSEDEESRRYQNDSYLSRSPECIQNQQSTFYKKYPCAIPQYRLCSIYKEEDGFSSDSSDNDVPLDLRIQRKKTPPKRTMELPAWVFCTRYSDRPSAGPRTRKPRQKSVLAHKRNRTAFNSLQLHQLNIQFQNDPYLSEDRRQRLSDELGLSESSVKIWFQNQRAKVKKEREYHPLAVQLAMDGLYNHKSVLKQRH